MKNWDRARQIVGDWIIYYEPWTSGINTLPRPIGRQAYFALAQVESIELDPATDSRAYLKLKNYLNFETAVPYLASGEPIESSLIDEFGKQSNVFRNAIRIIPDDEFRAIIRLGFPTEPDIENLLIAEEPSAAYGPWSPTRRTTRFAHFRAQVMRAHSGACAVSGLHLVDLDNNPEADAIHIMPPSADGADVVRNGIALSESIGWLFRRGLFTLSDDLKIIRHAQFPHQLAPMFPNEYVVPPADPTDRPHPKYLAFHREHVFGRGLTRNNT